MRAGDPYKIPREMRSALGEHESELALATLGRFRISHWIPREIGNESGCRRGVHVEVHFAVTTCDTVFGRPQTKSC